MTNARRARARREMKQQSRVQAGRAKGGTPAQQLMPRAVSMCSAVLAARSPAAVVQVIQAHASRAGAMRAELLALALMCVADEDSRGIVHALGDGPVLPPLSTEEA